MNRNRARPFYTGFRTPPPSCIHPASDFQSCCICIVTAILICLLPSVRNMAPVHALGPGGAPACQAGRGLADPGIRPVNHGLLPIILGRSTGNVSDVDFLPPVGRVLTRSSSLLQDCRRGETVMSSVRGRGGIFISYRREETAANAGRLYDRLSERFGEDRVFMDVDSIDIGVDFAKAVIEAVVRCNILLALIGRDWSAITDSKGKRRIHNPDDFVRIEIETALQRDIRVVPVLVDGAVLPQANDLPLSLRPLIRRQALELSYTGFRAGISRLIATVDEVVEIEPGRYADQTAGEEAAKRRAEDKAQRATRVTFSAAVDGCGGSCRNRDCCCRDLFDPSRPPADAHGQLPALWSALGWRLPDGFKFSDELRNPMAHTRSGGPLRSGAYRRDLLCIQLLGCRRGLPRPPGDERPWILGMRQGVRVICWDSA